MTIVNDTDIEDLIRKDKFFESINDRFGSPPDWNRPRGFISLSKIILEQQISLASANAHFTKLNGYINEFTPVNILALSDTEMRACQISRQKAKYLKALSAAIVEGTIDLPGMDGLEDEVIREQLTSVKGIGNWTTDIYLMFCLQKKDIFPIGDIAIVKSVRELTGLKTKEEILSLSEKWKPFRSLATYYLWHYYLSTRKKSSSNIVPV